MEFNWSQFEESHRKCTTKFKSLQQKIETVYQSKFDENHLVNNWLRTHKSQLADKPSRSKSPIDNPLMPLRKNPQTELLASASHALHRLNKFIYNPAEPEITAEDILTQLQPEVDINVGSLSNADLKNKAFFEENYQAYLADSSFAFIPEILNMTLSIAAQKSPWHIGYYPVLELEDLVRPTEEDPDAEELDESGLLEDLSEVN